MIPFVGYAPDLSPETPGIFLDCEKVVPLTNGFTAQGGELDLGKDALVSAARSLSVIRKADDSRRTFATTRTNIYELGGSSWTDVSDSSGYDVGADAQDRIRFAQFGNVTIAAVGTSTNIQSSTSGAFVAIASAPKAKIVETVNNFVFAFNYIDSFHGLGTRPNGWWCSALGDETDWTPSVSTQCVAGQFLETPGPVVAAKRLGSYLVAYKERSAYIAQYIGAPAVWSWQQLPGELGTFSQETIVNVGTTHFGISSDGTFFSFDGSRFSEIGSPVSKTFFADLDPQYRSRITHAHDKDNSLIYWYYPSKSGAGTIDSCIVYNYKTNQWGRSDTTIEAAAEFIDTGVTYDGMGTLYSTWDDLPDDISFDSSFWSASQPVVAYFNTSHKLCIYGGTPTTSSITTGHYGDVSAFSTVTKIRPRFVITPTSSTMQYSHSNTNADEMTQNLSTTLSNNVYDIIWSARWHKFKFSYVGAMKTTGFQPEISVGGME